MAIGGFVWGVWFGGLVITKYVAAPPNGLRLSCGASASGRKRPVLRYLLASAQTFASSKSRPRQLQALVRRRHPIIASFVRPEVCRPANEKWGSCLEIESTGPKPVARSGRGSRPSQTSATSLPRPAYRWDQHR